MKLFSPDVFLNGKRTYVQGTQMLSRAAEIVAAEDMPGALLKTAAFHAISDKSIDIALADEAPEGRRDLGFCQFTVPAGATLKAIFLERDETAPRRDVPPACTYTRMDNAHDHVLSGDWQVEGAASLEDLLVAIIQTVKSQHEDIGRGVHDIWFTGLRGAALPASGAFATGKGQIQTRFARYIGRDGQYQSLQSVTLVPADGGAEMRFPLTFAFKTERPLDAD